MDLVAAGDQVALSCLIRRHGHGLTVFATRFLGNRADAEDVVQAVFIRAWEKAGAYDPRRAKVSTWLYRIAKNRCIDAKRRSRLRRFVGLETVADALETSAPAAERQIADKAELAAARRAIAALPERQRMALLLSIVGDHSIADVANVLGTSQGAAEQLLVRARRRIRREMTDGDQLG